MPSTNRTNSSAPLSFTWDIHSLYELCAQNPPRDAKLLRAIHADATRTPHKTLTLAEDFCGTAALSRAWCDLSPNFHAVATDIHAPTLNRAKRLSTNHPRIKLIRADVRAVNDPADLIAVLNFSICELHARRDLLAYFKHARTRLARKKGVLICDLYGGADSYQTGLLDQTISPPRGHPAAKDSILYSWEQRTADPLTARVVNAMHFDVTPGGGKSKAARHQVFLDAFVYDWRLWTIPALREAMHEAGFKHTAVYPRTAGATDPEGNLYTRPIENPAELEEAFNVFIAAS
jgi:hypothetical protein